MTRAEIVRLMDDVCSLANCTALRGEETLGRVKGLVCTLTAGQHCLQRARQVAKRQNNFPEPSEADAVSSTEFARFAIKFLRWAADTLEKEMDG